MSPPQMLPLRPPQIPEPIAASMRDNPESAETHEWIQRFGLPDAKPYAGEQPYDAYDAMFNPSPPAQQAAPYDYALPRIEYRYASPQSGFTQPVIRAAPTPPPPRQTATGKFVQDPVAGTARAARLAGTGARGKTILTDASGGLGTGDLSLAKPKLGA